MFQIILKDARCKIYEPQNGVLANRKYTNRRIAYIFLKINILYIRAMFTVIILNNRKYARTPLTKFNLKYTPVSPLHRTHTQYILKCIHKPPSHKFRPSRPEPTFGSTHTILISVQKSYTNWKFPFYMYIFVAAALLSLYTTNYITFWTLSLTL